MTTTRTIVAGAIVLLAGVGIGTATATPGTATASATPEPRPSATAAPTPEATPRTVISEIEVVPQVCVDALDQANVIMGADMEIIIDVLSAYVDYPAENLAEFGARVETIIGELGNGDAEGVLFDEWMASYDACIRLAR